MCLATPSDRRTHDRTEGSPAQGPQRMTTAPSHIDGPVNRADLIKLARQRFGLKRFRPGQLALMDAVLAGQNALGILPTGAGKSLTYQLPSLVLEGAVLVVS